jgi:hypothetical protein
VERASVFDDVDVFGWPAGGYVREDDLLEEGPLGGGLALRYQWVVYLKSWLRKGVTTSI